VAEEVVDALEVIDVDQAQREGDVPRLRATQLALQALLEERWFASPVSGSVSASRIALRAW
jgi:hypothetical protein